VELAEDALDAGDEPFGSVLVGAGGAVLAEDLNRVGAGDFAINQVAPDVVVDGPADELTDQLRARQARHHRVTGGG